MVHGLGAGVARRIDNSSNTTSLTNNISDDIDLLNNIDKTNHHHHIHRINRNNDTIMKEDEFSNSSSGGGGSSNSSTYDEENNNIDKYNENDELLLDINNSDDILTVDNDDEENHDDDGISLSAINNPTSSSTSTKITVGSGSPLPTSNLTTTLIFLTSIIAMFACIFYFSKNLLSFLEMVEDFGILGNLIFVLSYLPTGIPLALFSIYIPLTLSSGFVYGFLHGFATVMIGSVVSAAAGFWITRKLSSKWLESKIESSSKLSSIRSMVEHRPFLIIIIMRLLPIPFGIQNGLCAMTRISFTTFIYSSTIGLVPENTLFVYIGTTLKSMADVTSGGHYQQSLLIIAIVAGVILSIVGKKVLSSSSPLFNINAPTITISSTSHETTTNNPKQIESTRDIILTIKSTSTSAAAASSSLQSPGLSSHNSNNNINQNNITSSTPSSISSSSSSSSSSSKPQSLPPTPFKSRIE